MHVRTAYVLPALACLFTCLGYSQAVTSTILGTVTDSSGAVVPKAKVTVTEVNTATTRTGVTNESGNYSFSNLAPGRYSVTVEATGFKKETRTGVDALVDTTARVDIQLTPGAITETVEVTGATPPLKTDRADVSEQIETAQTANLPLGTNRNFQNLLNLVPGTTPATFQHSSFFNASNSLQTEVDGQMRQGNSYQIEGIDDNERTGLLQIYVPPIEAIQTVDVATSNFEAELGRASGANANVVLKSGTNDLHGAAYEFVRNNAFNARNFFDKSVGHLAYNYVGGNLGGPIKKNKIFIFGDYLKVLDHEANTNTGTIPPTPWRTGDFSAQSNPIYDPDTGNPDGTGRQLFPGNMIPANRINPISAKILALVPQPNQQFSNSAPSSNYFALLPKTDDTDSFDVKIDDNISDKGRLSGRFSYSRPVIAQAPVFGDAGGFAQGAFQGTGIQKTYSAGINYDRIFSPTLIAEFRIGVAHYHNDALPTDYGTAAASALGIPGVNIDQWTSGMPFMNIGGFSSPLVGYSASLPWRRAEVNGDIANTWTKTKSNHTIKFGMDYRRIRDDLLQTQTVNPRGQWNFGVNQTSLNPGTGGQQPSTGPANDLASFLLDTPSFAGRDLAAGYFPALRGNELFLFAQDKWQATQKLTVDIGVRWEFYPPFTPRFSGGFSNYDPTTNTLQIAGIGSIPKDLGIKTRYHYFAPRLGLAYRLTDSTVIRAGFGVSYTPFPDNTYAFNYPIKQNKQYNAPNSFAVAVLDNGVTPATFQNGFPAPTFAAIPTTGILTNPDPSQADFVVPQNFKNPNVQSWNIAVQRALPQHFTLDVAYVGNHGVDSVVTYNLNEPTTVLGGGNASKPLFIKYGRTADTTIFFVGMSTHYNSLQVKLNRRFTNGLAITTSYTFGKGMSYQTGDDGGLWTYFDQRRSYARTDFDRTHTFAQSYVYELPFGVGKKWWKQGIVARVAGGWQVNAVFLAMTGTPMTFGANGGVLNTPGTPQTADQVGPYKVLGGINVPSQGGSPYFLQSSFVQPAGVRLGTSGRNVVSGPGFYNLDASIFKILAINERIKAEIRGESFSVLNNPHFSNPDTGVTDQNYGYITGAGGARGLQLGVKLSF
ncbi:MAG TPA: TonB-dependent receptor [Candidatus Sulfopaludibacter sp.]|jgi:outer membrane receptor protein involved in Fe transport|nr:TonB-dependent receptor [Candidatus Sulfopaludibacter sp.]